MSVPRVSPVTDVDPAMTPKEFVDSILSACDASNWDADRNTGDYFKGLRDAYEAIHEIAGEYQTAMYAWTRAGVAQAQRPHPQDVAWLIDGEAWKDGHDALPDSWWSYRRDIALRKADAIISSWDDLCSMPSTHSLCAKCGCETKGEAALVGDEVWCHPCADAQSNPAATPALDPGLKQAMEIVGEMRQHEAGIFDAKHSGQRGEDRSNALYDAYVAIRAALVSRPLHSPTENKGE